jgi:flagellar basal-body rod protein FlgB
VANPQTPGYRERDLRQLDFKDLIAGGNATGVISVATTNPMHIAIGGSQDDAFGADRKRTFEVTPDGNSVVMEDEMTKVADNQQDYQVATMLYTKSLNLLKMAVKGS